MVEDIKKVGVSFGRPKAYVRNIAMREAIHERAQETAAPEDSEPEDSEPQDSEPEDSEPHYKVVSSRSQPRIGSEASEEKLRAKIKIKKRERKRMKNFFN